MVKSSTGTKPNQAHFDSSEFTIKLSHQVTGKNYYFYKLNEWDYIQIIITAMRTNWLGLGLKYTWVLESRGLLSNLKYSQCDTSMHKEVLGLVQKQYYNDLSCETIAKFVILTQAFTLLSLDWTIIVLKTQCHY